MRIAITRPVSESINRCELTHLDRSPIDVALARAQHKRYEETLTEFGCRVMRLAEEPDLPDSVFVEDAAIVLDQLAVLTRPGAPSRRPEVDSVGAAIAAYRTIARIEAPGTVDGGDLLLAGRTVYAGMSSRSNEPGIAQLREILAGAGYDLRCVALTGCLHLKSAATLLGPDLMLVNRRWVEVGQFERMRLIDVDPAEPAAANALRVGNSVVFPASNPRTMDRLVRLGIDIRGIDVSELEKAEGGVTCCSLVFEE